MSECFDSEMTLSLWEWRRVGRVESGAKRAGTVAFIQPRSVCLITSIVIDILYPVHKQIHGSTK